LLPFVKQFTQLSSVAVVQYTQYYMRQWVVSNRSEHMRIARLLSCISDMSCMLNKFTLATETDEYDGDQLRFDITNHGLERVGEEIVTAVLRNITLLSCTIDIQHNGKDILSEHDQQTIQQHIEANEAEVRKGIEDAIITHSTVDDGKKDYAVRNLVFQYLMPLEKEQDDEV
jgi:hypothetical protein